MKKILFCLVAVVLLLSACGIGTTEFEGVKINLSDDIITVDGEKITDDNTQDVYLSNDIVYYPEGKDFTFGEGTGVDEHSQAEADSHMVVHINKAGRYVLNGKLSAGQIAVDLGEDAENNPDAVVTLILNGVDITCTVAPAVIFYNVYECGVADEEAATKDVDTTKAGANVIIADGTENNINGSYVAKIYKSYELNEEGTEVVDSKKLHKYDSAFYSKKTMNINGGDKGDGVLNIKAENEGLDSELHLTINGGIINITSGNDGINTNEDNVSVTTVNGGTLNIVCDGGTGEGDGIDSNGWLVINGGSVNAQACSTSDDAGIDSDKGIYINGGTVVATGNMLDHIAGGDQTYAVFNFSGRQSGGNSYILKNSDGKNIGKYAPANEFTCLIVADDGLADGDYTFWLDDTQLSAIKSDDMHGGIQRGERPQMYDDFETSEMPEGFIPHDMPEGEIPSRPNGERPQMPGAENPNGERPQMPTDEILEGFIPPEKPDGTENMTPPNGIGSMPSGFTANGVTSTKFTIVKGANMFANVSPAGV